MAEDGRSALDVFDAYRQEAGLSHGELWLRYFELKHEHRIRSRGLPLWSARPHHDHDVIAQALNERLAELGGNHPVPYVTL
jgi:hypothetical protein